MKYRISGKYSISDTTFKVVFGIKDGLRIAISRMVFFRESDLNLLNNLHSKESQIRKNSSNYYSGQNHDAKWPGVEEIQLNHDLWNK